MKQFFINAQEKLNHNLFNTNAVSIKPTIVNKFNTSYCWHIVDFNRYCNLDLIAELYSCSSAIRFEMRSNYL